MWRLLRTMTLYISVLCPSHTTYGSGICPFRVIECDAVRALILATPSPSHIRKSFKLRDNWRFRVWAVKFWDYAFGYWHDMFPWFPRRFFNLIFDPLDKEAEFLLTVSKRNEYWLIFVFSRLITMLFGFNIIRLLVVLWWWEALVLPVWLQERDTKNIMSCLGIGKLQLSCIFSEHLDQLKVFVHLSF